MANDNTEMHAAEPEGTRGVMSEMLGEMRAMSGRLRVFDPGAFGVPSGAERDDDRAVLAAGALVRAGASLLSCLFEDTALLLTDQDDVAEAPGRMIVLDDLPPAFAHLYTHAFAERFLIVTADVVAALHRPEWVTPGSVAERLALHLVITTARASLEIAEAIDWADSDEVYEPFRAAAFDDRDHERLYELERGDLPMVLRADSVDGAGHELAHWFRPFDDRRFVHPFVRD
jgi:hypothetical protein